MPTVRAVTQFKRRLVRSSTETAPRHATSKIKETDDLLSVATLGFRGEALPSIASVARLHLETRAVEESAGTVIEINGGKMIRVEEAGLPLGTSITVRDLFFNTPARKKFLKSESTELSHIASLVTHYALAHPEKHFELHSATNALLVAPPVAGHRERVYQVFGQETLDQLIPLAAVQPLAHVGLPQPPPWRRDPEVEAERAEPGEVRLHGFVSKPEIQKLNRNSIFIFVNGRLIRDRLIQQQCGVADERSDLPGGVGIFLEHLVSIERVGVKQRVPDHVLFADCILDVRAQKRGVEQVGDPQAASSHLVFVGGADAA